MRINYLQMADKRLGPLRHSDCYQTRVSNNVQFSRQLRYSIQIKRLCRDRVKRENNTGPHDKINLDKDRRAMPQYGIHTNVLTVYPHQIF